MHDCTSPPLIAGAHCLAHAVTPLVKPSSPSDGLSSAGANNPYDNPHDNATADPAVGAPG
jgi:hypothetical protein